MNGDCCNLIALMLKEKEAKSEEELEIIMQVVLTGKVRLGVKSYMGPL
jgi:hypothetical protein